ncbi:hypothetical protein [Sphingobium cupriresistens]|uniref:hypothetical protein n=1 Tax=Sphingobium cupriresistens TaxID=1132417 RepID=UPI0011E06E2C|nr:hypothetical protein [Sphingobium cupriresistens]
MAQGLKLMPALALICACGPVQETPTFNEFNAAEEREFQRKRAAGEDEEYNKILAARAPAAQSGNARRREMYGRAKAACENLAKSGVSRPQCPPKPPICYSEDGSLKEVPC